MKIWLGFRETLVKLQINFCFVKLYKLNIITTYGVREKEWITCYNVLPNYLSWDNSVSNNKR